MAFTLKERQILGIHGLLPPVVFTPDEQKRRVLDNVRRFTDDLDKYIYLAALLDRNEKLFYQVSHTLTHSGRSVTHTLRVVCHSHTRGGLSLAHSGWSVTHTLSEVCHPHTWGSEPTVGESESDEV